MSAEKIKKTCTHGHIFYKSSSCLTCPVCEKLKKPISGFLALLSSPARNALLHHGVDSLQKLSALSQKEVLKMHGIGKSSLPVLKKALEEEGLDFTEE